MLEISAPWLEKTIKDVSHACEKVFGQSPEPTLTTLERQLREPNELIRNDNDTPLVYYDKVIKKAYEILKDGLIMKSLQPPSQYPIPERTKIHEDVYFIGWLRIAYDTFIDAAMLFPCFQIISINCVNDIERMTRKRKGLYMEEALSLFHPPLNPSQRESYFAPLILQEAEEQFAARHPQRLCDHAELQMAFKLASTDE
jgi:hypothetical protein